MQINDFNGTRLLSSIGPSLNKGGKGGTDSTFSTEITPPFRIEKEVYFYDNPILSWSEGARELFKNLTGYTVNDDTRHRNYLFFDDTGNQPPDNVQKMLMEVSKVFETASREKISLSAIALDVDGITEAARKIVSEFDPNADIYEQLRTASQTSAQDTDVLDLLDTVLNEGNTQPGTEPDE